ncbi:MAG: phage portal protein, partial [Clostridiales bacterium]|nr:phage portal protein [Clostridiales bacterium]
MDKVNEFEHGEDRRPYNVSRSFQQLYGPEANFSYRAHTADEILSDVKKLREMIRDHYEKQCPRLAALDDYMKARNTAIYNDESRRVEEGKADHRAAHNFAKIINVFDVGYNTGIPIKKSS